MKTKVNYLLLFTLLFSPITALSEEQVDAVEQNKQHAALAQKVEGYLNNITSFQASFEQVIPGQPISTGMFYLQRPRKFLWQYNVPHAQKLVSNGKHLYFYDEESEQVTQLPLNSGIGGLLTAKKLQLQNDKVALKSLTEEGAFIKAVLSPKGEDHTVSFVFHKQPALQLVKLITTDELGSEIHVGFSQIKEKIVIDQDVFSFEPEADEF